MCRHRATLSFFVLILAISVVPLARSEDESLRSIRLPDEGADLGFVDAIDDFAATLAPHVNCGVGAKQFDGGLGGTGTAWETAANWSGDALPTSSDDVCIDGAAFAVVVGSGIQNAGTALVQNGASLTINGGSLTIAGTLLFQGGVLGGVGTITAPLVDNTGGQVAPGLSPSPGRLTLVGDYVQGANGGYTVELGGLTPETEHDQFAITNPGVGTGDATLGGALNATLINGFDPVIGDSFTIITSDTLTGQFATSNLPVFGCGKTWSIGYGATSVVLHVVAQPGLADLTVTNTDSPDPIAANDLLTYTVTVSNGGPDPATNTVLTDTLPAGTTYVSATPSQGACSPSSGTVICNLGTIANGANAVATIVVTPSAPGAIINSATAVSDECDPAPGDETDITTTTTVFPACPDGDSDAFAVCDASCLPDSGQQCGDCDDASFSIHPGATEACNGVDDDCAGGVPANEADGDSDGFRICANDCNDADPAVNPGTPEDDPLCADVIDNDCDGLTDLNDPSCLGPCSDADDDGFALCNAGCVLDPSDACGDCDDAAFSIHPGAPEACNGVDDDCAGGVPANEADGDSDGFRICANDCNDADPAINPGTPEDDPFCADAIDNDCDGFSDLLDPSCLNICADADNDGYAVCAAGCNLDVGDLCGDCNDAVTAIHPGATEIAGDNVDQNCDGVESCYTDADNDGYRPNTSSTVASPDTDCADSGEAVSTDPIGDCNDAVAAINPGANEITGDSVDQNCDGVESCYTDADNDGYRPNASSTVASADTDCLDSGEAVSTDPIGDCNDAAAAINPGANEIAGDSIDQNCDAAELCYTDADNDGYRPNTSSTVASADTDCLDSGEAVSSDPTGDCNDASAAIHPGATEIAGDSVDQNCDGVESCYTDADNDGYRPNGTSTVASADTDCLDSGEAVSTDPTGDCNDANAAIHPGANEIAGDNVDQNCDGVESCYTDADNDGYRPNGTSTVASADTDCLDSGEAVSTDPTGDCNDASAAINPGVSEAGSAMCADDVDNDCDGLTDLADLVGCGLAATVCDTLGDQPAPQRVDQDTWTFQGLQGETVTVQVAATGTATGRADLLLIDDMGAAVSFFKIDRTTLPNSITATLPATGAYQLVVQQQPSALLLPGRPFLGAYCVTFDADLGAAPTLAPTTSVESAFVGTDPGPTSPPKVKRTPAKTPVRTRPNTHGGR